MKIIVLILFIYQLKVFIVIYVFKKYNKTIQNTPIKLYYNKVYGIPNPCLNYSKLEGIETFNKYFYFYVHPRNSMHFKGLYYYSNLN